MLYVCVFSVPISPDSTDKFVMFVSGLEFGASFSTKDEGSGLDERMEYLLATQVRQGGWLYVIVNHPC